MPIDELLADAYVGSRRSLIRPDVAGHAPSHGAPVASCDTVYFTVVDGAGNACSFINSNYMGFGTGIVPRGCGFTLQVSGFILL